MENARAEYVKQVFPTLRPENFQPWNDTPPEDGRTLSEAILAFAPDILRRQVSMHLAMKNAFIESRDASQNLHASCWGVLRGRLRQKEFLARGWRRGASASGVIPAEFFDAATPDFDTNSVEARHDAYYDVRIFEADHPSLSAATPISPETSSSKGKNKGGRPGIHDWDGFRKELIRGCWAGEFLGKKQIREHMTNWCSATWIEQPDARTLRAELSKLLPDEIPER